jgi:hypothetical protein
MGFVHDESYVLEAVFRWITLFVDVLNIHHTEIPIVHSPSILRDVRFSPECAF